MSELVHRTVAGAILILVAVGAAWRGGNMLAILVALVAVAMYYEWRQLARGWGPGWQIAGFLYALLPALSLLWIRERASDGLAMLLWTFFVTWSTDIFAYLAGRAIGGPKLAPRISPNKTIAGLAGGIAGAAVVGSGWAAFAGLSPSLYILAPLFALAAQGGDLFESWMKRQAGVKDSGHWLPGHGGFLDRLDGLVPVAILSAVAVQAGLA